MNSADDLFMLGQKFRMDLKDDIYSISFSPYGKYLATASKDNTGNTSPCSFS